MHLLSKLVRNNAFAILLVSAVIIGFGISYASGVFTELKKDEGGLSVENSQSLKASRYIKDAFGGESKQVVILVKSPDQNIDSVEFKNTFDNIVKPFEKSGAKITSYYSTGAKELKSANSRSTYALAEFQDKSDDVTYEFIQDQPLVYGNTKVQFGGTLVASRQISHQIEQDLVRAELISLPILLALLIIIFRSVTAAVLPVLLGVVAVIGGTSVVRLIAHYIDIDQYAINVITVLGLGLSIDYSLLMVSRFREELHKHNKYDAINHTIRSSGRTILFSGLTVMICLLGLTLFPISFLRSVGVGGIAALAFAIIAALTILPSLLLIIGENINRGKLGRRQRKQLEKKQSNRWHSLGSHVLKNPLASILVAVLIVLIAAMPLAHVKIKSSGVDYRSLPRGSSSREVSKSLDQDFHNETPSLQVVYINNDKINTSNGIKDVYDVTQYLANLPGVTKVEGLTANPTKAIDLPTYQALYNGSKHPPQLAPLEKQYLHDNTTYIKVFTRDDTTAKSVQDLVKQLRDYTPDNGHILVDGAAAVEYDIRASVAKQAPIALGLVVIAIMVLLSLLLRSIVIPIQALVINSFSLLAAFGILVWIFQDGYLTNIGWFMQTGSLDLTILILIFAITFGLSMDYATFYYSRVREEYDRTGKTEKAILDGLVLTGPVITQAAILLFVVVIAFATSNIALLQQVGLGLALAVLIDAFIVRIILVPAVMKITGRANWYAPKFLQKLGIRHD